MYENFIKLEEDKRKRIENAAYEIFAKNGYKKASTLDIIEKAQISKGALFHYFGSKENLYFYLYDLGIEVIMNEINLGNIKKNPDFFLRMEEATKAKMKAMMEHPFVYSFFVKVYLEEDCAVKDKLTQRLLNLAENQSILLDDIDMSKFRKITDLHLLSNLIVNFAVEFIQTKFLLNPQQNIEAIVEAFQEYLDMLKNNFYKEEYL